MMLHVPGVLSAAEVADMRRRLAGADWTDGRATVGPQGAQVKRNRQVSESCPVGAELGRAVLAALARCPLYLSAALPHRISAPHFNRYEGGEHYGLHVDGSIRAHGDAFAGLRTDVSSTLFLSDPDDYEGGELEVVDTWGVHEVKLPAGDLVLYSSASLHRVMPVTRGCRLASFLWAQSMVADDGRRQLLFDLDQNVQKLRGSIGDRDEVVALTGIYHNLVRQWAVL